MKFRLMVTCFIVLPLVSGCAERTQLLYAEPANSLRVTTTRLQSAVDKAEAAGCRIQNVSMGAGHGTGLGLGVGAGVGINIEGDCPDCAKDKMNRTVIRRESRKVSESVFGAIAMARCPIDRRINIDGSLQ